MLQTEGSGKPGPETEDAGGTASEGRRRPVIARLGASPEARGKRQRPCSLRQTKLQYRGHISTHQEMAIYVYEARMAA